MKSRQTFGERLSALIWLPFHAVGLPLAFSYLYLLGVGSETWVNFACYLVGFLFMLVTQWRFLRRDFDTLFDAPLRTGLTVIVSYFAINVCNIVTAAIIYAVIGQVENPNNNDVLDLLSADPGPITAMAVFMAPLVEEMIFRGGIFGACYRRSRWLAYAVSAVAFSAYHVWGYALSDWSAWIYAAQYLPVALVLAYCYERTDTIWGPVLLHMMVNYLEVKASGV